MRLEPSLRQPKVGLPLPLATHNLRLLGCPVREKGIGGGEGEGRREQGGGEEWVTPRAGLSLGIRLFVLTVVDWLILQVPYAAVFEGEPLVLRCRGWYDKIVYKLHYYHDGQPVRYFHSSANYTVLQARASDSGRYQCSGTMRVPVESAPMFSAKVAVTVQGGGERAG